MIIDSHQHFWKYDPVRDQWIDDTMEVIRKDFLPDDLRPVLKNNAVDGSIAVQADPSTEETEFLLQLAHTHAFIQGVVGWVDVTAQDVESQLARFSKDSKFKGVRHIVQSEADGFLLRKDFQLGISKLRSFDLSYDILIYPHQLPDTISFVSKFPDQVFVLDHMAKPYIKSGKISTWKKQMRELASFQNVYCKISGMVTEAHHNQWDYDDFTPYLDTVFDVFGPQRILFGSDWPVCLLSASYTDVMQIVLKYISELSMDERDAILGGNAIQAYKLN